MGRRGRGRFACRAAGGRSSALSSALTSAAVAQTNKPVLRIGAIPDQKPEKLNRLYGLVANELSKQLGVDVKYVPVTKYACLLYTSDAADE